MEITRKIDKYGYSGNITVTYNKEEDTQPIMNKILALISSKVIHIVDIKIYHGSHKSIDIKISKSVRYNSRKILNNLYKDLIYYKNLYCGGLNCTSYECLPAGISELFIGMHKSKSFGYRTLISSYGNKTILTCINRDTTSTKIPFLPKFKITICIIDTPKNEFMESAPKCGYLPNNVAMMGIDLSESTKIENYISFVNYKSTIHSMCDILSSVLRNYNTL